MLKGGLVGLGRMGITHFSILNTHPDVRFVAACDATRMLARSFEKHVGVKTYADYRDMLNTESLDFLIVATPSSLHAGIVREAVARDVHTFVEKPLCLSVAEGRELVEMLKGRQLVNQVGYVNRFNSVFAEVKRLLDDELIGPVLTFRSEMHGRTVLKDSRGSWRGKKKTGGGCLYEFASHGIDLVNYLVGVPETVAGSALPGVYSSSVEDVVFSTFFYDKGTVGSVFVNWSDASYRKPANRIELFGTGGRITADQHTLRVYLRDSPAGSDFTRGWNVRYVTDLAKPVRFYVRGFEFTAQLDYFIESIMCRRQDNLCSFAAGLDTDVILEKIIVDSDGRD